MAVHSVIVSEPEEETVTDSFVTSFRVSRTEPSAIEKSPESDSHEGSFLINLVHPSAYDCYRQSAWMAEGAVVVVDLFSGVSQETTQLLRLLIGGGVKPILFIDRLDHALDADADSEDIYIVLSSIVGLVNEIIAESSQDDSLVDYRVSVEEGSVMFGSLQLDWAFNVGHFGTLYTGADEFGLVEIPLARYLWVCRPYMTLCKQGPLTMNIRATDFSTQK
jgi:translation elongation factor EF-G